MKLLGFFSSICQTLREFEDLKQGVHMGPVVLNLGLAYTHGWASLKDCCAPHVEEGYLFRDIYFQGIN